ncbi:MAG: HEAT repeat domain-containing protein, partial [Planctomycetota bacterium]
PLGANVTGPEVTQRFFRESRWLHTLYRAWDGGFTFDGGGYKAGNSSGSHLLAYCIPRRKLYITGKNADESVWLKGREATDAIELSRIDYKGKSADDLIELFGHPIAQVTRRAVWTLREKKGEFIPRLVKMMKEGTKIEKQSAIGYFGYGCPKETALPRLDDLGSILRDTGEDPEVRAAAAGALCWLGEPAYKYYNDMVKFVVDDEPGDIFRDVDWSLGRSIEALCKDPFKAGLVTDKDLFYRAALKLADNKRQHVRAHGLRMLAGIALEDFPIVADKVMHVIRDRDPTYHSYHSPGGPVGAGITVLANLNIEEGIRHVLDVLDTDSGKWGFKVRMVMSVLPKYGANAKSALEKLRADPRLKNIEKGRFGGAWKAMVKAIEEDRDPPELMTFEEAKRYGLKNGE